MTTQQIRECRFLVAVMSADMAILDESASPIVESDPDNDVVLRTAWELGAAIVVSDDKRHLLNRGGSPRIWTDPSTGRSTEVLSLNDFIHEHVNTSSFMLQDLDVDIAQVIPLLLGRLAGT
jgi:predicted nucleic acid-binding protein